MRGIAASKNTRGCETGVAPPIEGILCMLCYRLISTEVTERYPIFITRSYDSSPSLAIVESNAMYKFSGDLSIKVLFFDTLTLTVYEFTSPDSSAAHTRGHLVG